MRWTGIAEMRNAYIIFIGKPEGKRLSGKLGISGKIILEWILQNCGVGLVPMVSSCEHGYESSGSIKGREFLHQLSDC
jgi:hypothetical protein